MIEFKHRLPCWFEIYGVTTGPLIRQIRIKIKSAYRFFDEKTNCWVVHYAYITWVTAEAKKYFNTIQYNTLPTEWQMRAAGAIPTTGGISVGIPELPSPFNILHLLDNAPLQVVSAAYRALAVLYHPDRGGNTSQFQEISDAYQRCLEILDTSKKSD